MRARQINVVSNSANIVADIANLGTPSADNPAYVKARPGLHLIDKTIIIPSYTTLDLTGCTVRLSPGNNRNIIRNRYAQNRLAAARFSCVGAVCTVTEYGHSREIGDVVYIAGLATNTTLNGPQVVTGAAADTWTFAIADATAPTGYGAVSVYNPIAGASFVRASNVVTVTEAGHGRRRGDAVYVEGLLTDTSFNGAVRVKSVSGDTWTYDSTGADGSPTGTANVLGDTHITLLGGEIDWDNDNQVDSGATPGRFAVVFGNVGALSISDQLVANVQKYTYWIFNSADANCRALRFDTDSDGVHFEAPAYNPMVYDIAGRTGDDLVAFTNVNPAAVGGLYPGYASPSGMGDFEGIRCDKLFRHQYSGIGAIVKITGNAGYTFGDVLLSNLSGYASNGAVAVVDDGADLVGTAGSSITINNVRVGPIEGYTPKYLAYSASGHWDTVRINGIDLYNTDVDGAICGLSAFDLDNLLISDLSGHEQLTRPQILFSGVGTLKRLVIQGTELDIGAGGRLVQTASASVVIDEVRVGIGKITGTSSGYVVFQNAGRINRAFFDGISYDTIDSLLRQNSALIDPIDIYMTNIHQTNGNAGVIVYSGGNIFLSNVRSITSTSNFLQIANGAWKIRGAGNNDILKPALLTTGAATAISISDPSLKINLDPAVSTKLAPQAGDRVWNTNAGFGAGIGMYGYTNAGAWSQIF